MSACRCAPVCICAKSYACVAIATFAMPCLLCLLFHTYCAIVLPVIACSLGTIAALPIFFLTAVQMTFAWHLHSMSMSSCECHACVPECTNTMSVCMQMCTCVHMCKELCICVATFAMPSTLPYIYCAMVLPVIVCSSGTLIAALLHTLQDSGSPHNALHSPSCVMIAL